MGSADLFAATMQLPMPAFAGPREVTHVVFDLDGVLLDTEKLYSVANSRLLQRYGCTFTTEMKNKQMGRPIHDAMRVVVEMNGLLEKGITQEEYTSQYIELLEEWLPNSEDLPGGNMLIEHFYGNRIPLAICTGSDATEFEWKTRKFSHWLDLIPKRVLCGSDADVKRGKPHPDPYLVTMARCFDNPPARAADVLVFEDSINGVRSALAAGCTVVMVPQREYLPANWSELERELRPQLADLLHSLTDFRPENYGLPPLK